MPNLVVPDPGPDALPDVSGIPCPKCGAVALTADWLLVAKPLGTWSLAGMQNKVSAVRLPRVTCGSCGVTGVGHK